MADSTSARDQLPNSALEASVLGTGGDGVGSRRGLTSLVDDMAATASALEPSPEPGRVTAPTTGTATPFEMDAEQRSNSLKVSLADLCARAMALYAHKSYDEAGEVFAQAAEMQAEMRGEMDPENAEILFLYGRALFRVGQSKSDVLGGKAPDAKKRGGKGEAKAKKANGAAARAVAEGGEQGSGSGEASGAAAEEEEQRGTEETRNAIADETNGAKKPLFQFTGDENFDESDEEEDVEEEGEAEGDGEDEEDDDLAVAFEILDLARVLFGKRLEAAKETDADDKGKEREQAEDGDTPNVRHIKERLADTHDLLAEISLENERYPNAMIDFRQSLKLKEELYPEESEIIAEAHYKLSLALEFASVTTSEEDSKESGPKAVDQGLRDEAAAELEAAIRSTKLKLDNKEVELATLHSPEDNDNTRKQIAEVKDIIADMEQRLADLRNPPVDINAALATAGGDAKNPLGGILGAALGESSGQTAARVEEAKKNARDLTGLVRKKYRDEPAAKGPTPSPSAAAGPPVPANGAAKRKAADEEEQPPAAAGKERGASKKARVEDVAES